LHKSQSFQNGDLEVAFYRVACSANNAEGLPFSNLSRVKMHYSNQEGKIRIENDALKCRVTGLDAYMVDNASMAPLVHIFLVAGESLRKPWNPSIPMLGSRMPPLSSQNTPSPPALLMLTFVKKPSKKLLNGSQEVRGWEARTVMLSSIGSYDLV
jgi:hypothetical protein